MSAPEFATFHTNIYLGAQGAGRRWAVAVAVLALAGAGLVLLRTAKYGAGIEPDSVNYFDIARNLVSRGEFVSYSGDPYVAQPPLYPVLLALIGFATRLDPAAFAHLVNAALFALVICMSAGLLQTGSRQTITYSLLGVCAVLFSGTLSWVYASALSECLFIPLVLLFLVSAQHHWGSRGRLSLAVMTLSTALACLTRYIGVALVPAGLMAIILAAGVNSKKRFTRAFAFAVPSLAPLGLWLARNHRLTGTLMGPRYPSELTFARNIVLCAKVIRGWYLFVPVSGFVILAWIAILTIMLLSSRTGVRTLTSSLKAILKGYSPTVLFLVTYILMLLMASSTVAYDLVDVRLLSPVYIPATLVLLKLVSHLLSPTQLPTVAFVRKVPSALLALWLCFPLENLAVDTAGRFRNGAGGYNTKAWRESETVAYARQMLSTSEDVHVYSNGPDVLRLLANVSATGTPQKTEYSSTKLVNQLGDLKGRWPDGNGALLVWFDNITWRKYLFSVAELGEIADVVQIARLSDGAIYRISQRQPAVSDSGPCVRVTPAPPPLSAGSVDDKGDVR